jgi:hypothetical protein
MPPKKRCKLAVEIFNSACEDTNSPAAFLSHIDPHSNADARPQRSGRLPSAADGANLLNNVRVNKLPIRGDVYELQPSPEKPASKKVGRSTSNKQQRKQHQQLSSHSREAGSPSVEVRSPSVEAGSPSVETGSSNGRKRTRSQSDSAGAAPAIEQLSTSRPTRSIGRNITKSVPPLDADEGGPPVEAEEGSSGREGSELLEREDDGPPNGENDGSPDEANDVSPNGGDDGPLNGEDDGPFEEREDDLLEEGEFPDKAGSVVWSNCLVWYRANLNVHGQIDNHLQVPVPPTFDGIFSFIASAKRPGQCQTQFGMQLQDLCKRSCLAAKEASKPELAGILETATREIAGQLTTINKAVPEEDRVAFKRDAYAYIFRALALYLQALHAALCEEHGDLEQSEYSLRILYRFIGYILFFKTVMTSWRVQVPGRYKRDQLIGGTNNNFIAPLRQLKDQLQLKHSRLCAHESDLATHQVLLQEQEVRVQETKRREEVERSESAWRKRWHHLHVRRMQCERDIIRRKQHLMFLPAPDLVERDSNGVPIERVSSLGHRTHPPPRWLTSDEWEGEDWTEAQDVALVETLQMFPGL